MRLLPAVLASCLLPLAACGGDDSRSPDAAGPVPVVAGFYPLEFLVERIGGQAVAVRGLAEPGAEPHDLELTPQQVAAVSDARLVVYLRGFQPAVDAAVESHDRVLDVATVQPLEPGYVPIEDGELHEDERGTDPHVWLDPQRFATLAAAVEKALAEADPEGATGYRSRREALQADLAALDGELRTGLARCVRTDLVTSHNAFGYLARAYGLQQIGIAGLTPEQEPTPARLAAVTDLARKRGVTTVFFESLVSPKVAQSLAREIGARAEVLDPIESRPVQGDYLTVMRANTTRLRAALGCA